MSPPAWRASVPMSLSRMLGHRLPMGVAQAGPARLHPEVNLIAPLSAEHQVKYPAHGTDRVQVT